MKYLFLLLFAVVGSQSCKSRAPQGAKSAMADAGSESQRCEFAQRTWNNIYGSRYGTSVNQLPPMKGQLSTAFNVFRDPALALKTFLPGQNALNGEEISRDSNGRPTRPKAIHAAGSVARIKFVANSSVQHPYTGLFKSGTECGLIRVSLAVKGSAEGINPGAALKFYIDSFPESGIIQPQSLNIHVMYQLDAVRTFNALAFPFSNVLPPPIAPKLIVGSQYFSAALAALHAEDTFGGHLTVDHLASYSADGRPVPQPVAPYRITLVPSRAAVALMALSGENSDFRVELTRFQPGEKLYDVYADETKVYHAEPFGTRIGEIVTTSEFVASKYGDELLHFAHHTKLKM